MILGGSFMLSLFFFNCTSSSINQKDKYFSIISPENNVITSDKIEFGKKLFFDKQLSIDNTVSCATCHIPELAFTDGKVFSDGVNNLKTARNSPTLLNAAFLPTVMFDAHLTTLEKQVIVPIQEHNEMGMDMLVLLKKLRNIPEYNQLANEIFDRDFDGWVLTRAISAFERSLISDNSAFDKYYYEGDKSAMSKSAVRGWELFSKELYCTKCHPTPYFTNFLPINNGLHSDYSADKGRYRVFHDSINVGAFKVPTLRNINLTKPYMHDGSIPDLTSVIQHYQSGGSNHFNKDERIMPFEISEDQTIDLIHFFEALTDTSYMVNFR